MDYSKVTLVEYEQKKQKIFDEIREGLYAPGCLGIYCSEKCPLWSLCRDYGFKIEQAEPSNPIKAAKLIMEFKPPVDWSKVPVDTKILVKDRCEDIWEKRHFAEYKDGMVLAWNRGNTSFTANGNKSVWAHAKLYNEEDK